MTHRLRHLGQSARGHLATVTIVAATICGLSLGSYALFRQDDSITCQSNLKQIALGMLMYCQDYDEKMPPTKTARLVQNRIMPYVKNQSIFSCPATGEEYLPNPALNYVYIGSVKTPQQMMMLRDAKPHTSGAGGPFWNVAYADGHVKSSATEPALGKLAPSPPPLSRRQIIDNQLQQLRMQKLRVDAQIKRLEAEQRRLRR
jgi:hypothetical protein